MTDPAPPLPLPLPLYADHGRTYRENKFVYPVLSRRSGGISIGVNLNPDKVCNFDCIYCQVDRRSEAETRFVETDRLLAELDAMFRYVDLGRNLPGREVRRRSRSAAAAQRRGLLRRRRADDLSQFRRDHRGGRRPQNEARPRRREDGA